MFKRIALCLGLSVAAAAAWAGAEDDCRQHQDAELRIRACTEIIVRDPKSASAASAYLNRGNAHFGKGDNDRAIADHTDSARLNPRQVGVYYFRGLAYQAKDDHDRAIADFTKVIESDESDFAQERLNEELARGLGGGRLEVYPLLPEVHYRRAKSHQANKDHDRATKDYDRVITGYSEAIKLNPRFAGAYYGRGEAHQGKEEYDRAIADYTKVIDLDRGHLGAHFNRGSAYQRRGEYERAIADYSEVIRLRPLAEIYYLRGLAYRSHGDSDRAIADFTRAIEIKPSYSGAYVARGDAYLWRGEFGRANADFNKAQRSSPSFVGLVLLAFVTVAAIAGLALKVAWRLLSRMRHARPA